MLHRDGQPMPVARNCRMSLIAELKRRNVHRAAVFYAGAAWLLVQVATQVFPFFDIPNWAVRIVIVAALIGFPFAIVFSWLYEWTPQGIKLESEVDRSGSTTRQTGKKLDRWIIAVLILAVVLLMADKLVLHNTRSVLADKSIAVLPFANTSGDAANEYFSDGLSEELISSLSRLANLKVIGRTSSFRFKGKTADSKTIGEALGVGYLLEGSVRKSADRVRIAVALLKAGDGINVWSESYDRELKDIFAVQSEIAGAVADELKIALLGNNAQLAQTPTQATPSNRNVAAYTALLQANFHANRQTEADHRKAIDYYEEAIRLDPGYALAYAGLAVALTDLASIWLGGEEATADYAKARSAVQTALKLAPDLSQAHVALADLILQAELDVSGAGEEYRRAVALAPADIVAKLKLGYWLAARGQHDQAIGVMREALALDPLQTEGYVFYGQGHIDEAEAVARKGLELQPDASRLHVVLTQIALLRDQNEQALAQAQLEGAGFWHDFAITLALQKQGDAAAADAALQQLIDRYSVSGGSQIAIVYALRKDPDRMFEWLERAHAERDTGSLMLPFNDPFLMAYEDDPRFAAFCKKTGLTSPGEP
jgi:TolB-like protein/Tfp pilus assembly protein PilF